MRAGVTFITVLAVLLGLPGTARAVCEDPPDLGLALLAAPVAFIGTVDQTDLTTGDTSMTVLWVWKGVDIPEDVTVTRPRSGAGEQPGVAFTSGATYLVIPENDRSPFQVAECGGTRRFRGDGQVIPAELQGPVGRSVPLGPGMSFLEVEESGSAPWGLLAGAALALAATALWLYRRKPRSDPDAAPRHRFRNLAGLTGRGRSGSSAIRRIRRRGPK